MERFLNSFCHFSVPLLKTRTCPFILIQQSWKLINPGQDFGKWQVQKVMKSYEVIEVIDPQTCIKPSAKTFDSRDKILENKKRKS